MSYPIPKIQYKNVDEVNGFTTSASRIVLDSIVGLEVGMFIIGPGVPDETFIDSIETLNSAINLNRDITPTLGDLFSFGLELEFRFPPEKNDNRESIEPDQTISQSRSGVRQYLTRYLEKKRPLEFNFLNLEEIVFLETMFNNWFSLGEFVRWFDDQALDSYVEYQADDTKFDPKFIQGTSELYSLKLDFVRV